MDYYNISIKPIIEFKITVICDTVTLLIYIYKKLGERIVHPVPRII